MSKRPVTPLAIAVPATKGSAYVPETQTAHADAPARPDSAGVTAGEAGPPAKRPLPVGPVAMNFKLTPSASLALRSHHFRTGRSKQSIVEEALDEWLARNEHLIS